MKTNKRNRFQNEKAKNSLRKERGKIK